MLIFFNVTKKLANTHSLSQKLFSICLDGLPQRGFVPQQETQNKVVRLWHTKDEAIPR